MKYTFDSREVQPGDVFVALKGEKVDGHAFIDQAKAAGAVDVVDGIEDLQNRARQKRRGMRAKVIGVTGSAGKTTTKEVLKAFFAQLGKTYGTLGNFNNHIGLPLTILNAPEDVDYLVLEMGTNHPGEIAALCDIAEPDVGVLVSIGTAHLEFFKTREGIAAEKGTLLERARDFGVFPSDSDFAAQLAARCRVAVPSVKGDEILDSATPWPPHFADNVSVAFACASRFGLSASEARVALEGFALPGARWRKTEKWGVTFIDDSYNANPDSMIAALDAFAATPCEGKHVAVLGDMFELGPDALELHRKVFEHAMSLHIPLVIGVGEMSSQCLCNLVYKDLKKLKLKFRLDVSAGDLVLLKASHGMNLSSLLENS